MHEVVISTSAAPVCSASSAAVRGGELTARRRVAASDGVLHVLELVALDGRLVERDVRQLGVSGSVSSSASVTGRSSLAMRPSPGQRPPEVGTQGTVARLEVRLQCSP